LRRFDVAVGSKAELAALIFDVCSAPGS